MSTPSTLVVRFKGRDRFLHSHSDGQIHNVLAELVSTLAAAGLTAVCEQLASRNDRGELPEFIDRREMCNRYLEACRARGREPVLLEQTLFFDFGEPDFAHGGAIPFFSPDLRWDTDEQCWGMATFLLDMDRHVLEVCDFSRDDPREVPPLWSLDLLTLEKLPPVLLYHAFFKAKWKTEDDPAVRVTHLEQVLDLVRTGAVKVPRNWLAASPYAPRRLRDVEQACPSVHTLTGAPMHMMDLYATVAFLEDFKEEFPIFGKQDTIRLLSVSQDQLQVRVDLRHSQDAGPQNAVQELWAVLPKRTGMLSASFTPHSKTITSFNSMTSETTVGRTIEAWESEAMTDPGWPAPALEAFVKQVADLAQRQEVGFLEELRLITVVSLRGDRWHLVEDTGLLEELDEKTLGQLGALTVLLCACFERAWPGSTAKRLDGLDKHQRAKFLGALSPVDHRVLEQLMAHGTPAKPCA